MTAQSDVRSPSKQRRTTLRVFYVFVFASIAAFTLGVRASHSQEALTMLGILLAGGGIWSFLRFLRAADAHQKLINHEATSFAFVASLLLTLVVGLSPAIRVAFRCLSLGPGFDDCASGASA